MRCLRRIILSLLVAGPCGATTTIAALNITPMQVITDTNTNQVGNCAYVATPGSVIGTPIDDVNTSLFPGSNSDARDGSLISGTHHYFVFGTRDIQVASDGKPHSRGLQNSTQYTFQATCGGDAAVSVTLTTANPAQNAQWPELPRFDSTFFGNRVTCANNWTDQSATCIDPWSGNLLKRAARPDAQPNGITTRGTFSYYRDLSGTWTNAANVLTNQVPGTLATSSTLGNRLFVAWNSLGPTTAPNWGTQSPPLDLLVRFYLNGTGSASDSFCLSIDSTTCNTPTQTIVAPVGSPAEVDFPSSGYPTPFFNGWGTPTVPLSMTVISNKTTGQTFNIATTGGVSTFTLTGGLPFAADWPAGAKVVVTGCPVVGGYPTATITSVNATTMKVAENCGTATGATLQYYGAGILFWLSAGTSTSVSMTFDTVTANQNIGGQSANQNTCSGLTVTDINTDRVGNPISPNQTGELCEFNGGGLYLFIPSITGTPTGVNPGEMRLLDSFYNTGVGYMSVFNSPFSNTSPTTFFATNSGNNHLYKAVYTPATPGAYVEYNPGFTGTPAANPTVVWTDLTVTATPIATQLATFGGTAAAAVATNAFPLLAVQGVIDGYVYYGSSNGGDSGCIIIKATADTNTIIQGYTSWDNDWGGCHFSPQGVGQYSREVMNPMLQFGNGAAGGPYPFFITGMPNRTTPAYTTTITGVTNAAAAHFTATNISLDEYYNNNWGTGAFKGPTVTISGFTGSWAPANGTWQCQVTFGDINGFTCPGINSTGYGPLSGSPIVTTAPPLMNSSVVGITNTVPPVVTTSVVIGTGATPNDNRLQDGDPINFSSQTGSQYFAKKTGYAANQFAVYNNQSLTTPTPFASLPAAGGTVRYAEQCPGGLPTNLTSGLQFDSTGAVGFRCVTFTIANEPCSLWATAAEQAAYPCASDPSNPVKSQLQQIGIGQMFKDIARGNTDEVFMIVAKSGTEPGPLTITAMGFYGDLVAQNSIRSNSTGASHDAGWTPFMAPSLGIGNANGFHNINDRTNTFQHWWPGFAGCHGDIGWGYPNDGQHVTFAPASAPGCLDPIINVTIPQLIAVVPTQTSQFDGPYFPGTSSLTVLPITSLQSYPGHRQKTAPYSEMIWKSDFRATNPASGSGQMAGGNWLSGSNPSLVPGTQHVYQVTITTGTPNIKLGPLYGFAGPRMFKDISSPTAVISDAVLDGWCYPYANNECVSGSVGHGSVAYVSGKGLDISTTYCLSNTYNDPVPCVYAMNAKTSQIVEEQISPIDTLGTAWRTLGYGGDAPSMHFSFQSLLNSPDGTWGFYDRPWLGGYQTNYWMIKLPKWNTVAFASGFVYSAVQYLPPPGSTYARIRFGYAENADPTLHLYCTSRADECSTDIPIAHPSDPYSFVSEAATHMVCTNPSGCNINVPTIPNRITYFKVDSLNGAGMVIATTSLGIIGAGLPVPPPTNTTLKGTLKGRWH